MRCALGSHCVCPLASIVFRSTQAFPVSQVGTEAWQGLPWPFTPSPRCAHDQQGVFVAHLSKPLQASDSLLAVLLFLPGVEEEELECE